MSIVYNEDTLNKLRRLADELAGPYPKDWQWIGQHVSQRMSGITEAKARYYAAKHGGEASQCTVLMGAPIVMRLGPEGRIRCLAEWAAGDPWRTAGSIRPCGRPNRLEKPD